MFNETGVEKVFFRLKGGLVDHSTLREIRVYDVPKIFVESYFYPQSNQLSVLVNVSGDVAKNITFSFENKSFNVSELYGVRIYDFDLKENSNVSIMYMDLSDRLYSIQVVSKTRNEGFLEKLARVLGELMRFLLARI